MTVSFLYYLIEEAVFLRTSNEGALDEPFVAALDDLATQTIAQMKLKFLKIATSVKSGVNQKFAVLDQRGSRRKPIMEFKIGCIKEEEQDVSTKFSHTQKNELYGVQDLLE